MEQTFELNLTVDELSVIAEALTCLAPTSAEQVETKHQILLQINLVLENALQK